MSVVEHRYHERKTNLTMPDVDSNRRTEGLMLREPKLVIKLIEQRRRASRMTSTVAVKRTARSGAIRTSAPYLCPFQILTAFTS